MDKFDHLIAARSGFKGNDLVEFNKGTSKAQAKGSLYGLEGASMVVPVPLVGLMKGLKLGYTASKNYPKIRRVVDVAGRLFRNMSTAGQKTSPTRSIMRPQDNARRATQVASEMAEFGFAKMQRPMAQLASGLDKPVLGLSRLGRVQRYAGDKAYQAGAKLESFLLNATTWHRFANTSQTPIRYMSSSTINTARPYEKTRKALDGMDRIYKAASARTGPSGVGTNPALLYGRLGILRHSIDSGPLGQMNRERKNGSK